MTSVPAQISIACNLLGSQAALARAVGVAPAMVSQWLKGVRPVAVERAAQIEAATNGAIKRWDLFPDDWHRIWPELKRAEGAPDVPERVA